MAAMGMGRGAVALVPCSCHPRPGEALGIRLRRPVGSVFSLNATGVALVHLLLCLERKMGPWSERGCSELG